MKNFTLLKEHTKEKNSCGIYALRALLSLLVIVMLAFIFSNSLASGETSAGQSNTVTLAVQEVFALFLPSSFIATAEGEDFERLHSAIRLLAHFGQFALLGALAFWCYLSYTRKKSIALVPALGVALVAGLDEYLQSFVAGRAAEVLDLLVDIAGGLTGMAFALLTFRLGVIIWKRRKKNARKHGNCVN